MIQKHGSDDGVPEFALVRLNSRIAHVLCVAAAIIVAAGVYYEWLTHPDKLSLAMSVTALLLTYFAASLYLKDQITRKGTQPAPSTVIAFSFIGAIVLPIIAGAWYSKSEYVAVYPVIRATDPLIGEIVDEILGDRELEKHLFSLTLTHPVVHDPVLARFVFGVRNKRERMLLRLSGHRFHPKTDEDLGYEFFATHVVAYYKKKIKEIYLQPELYDMLDDKLMDIIKTNPYLMRAVHSDWSRKVGAVVTEEEAMFYWKDRYHEEYVAGLVQEENVVDFALSEAERFRSAHLPSDLE